MYLVVILNDFSFKFCNLNDLHMLCSANIFTMNMPCSVMGTTEHIEIHLHASIPVSRSAVAGNGILDAACIRTVPKLRVRKDGQLVDPGNVNTVFEGIPFYCRTSSSESGGAAQGETLQLSILVNHSVTAGATLTSILFRRQVHVRHFQEQACC